MSDTIHKPANKQPFSSDYDRKKAAGLPTWPLFKPVTAQAKPRFDLPMPTGVSRVFNGTGQGADNSYVDITPLSEIDDKPIEWLWKNWLPKGMMALLAGKPGIGKSTLAYYCAATISRGGFWPDGTKAEKGYVFIWSSEDPYDKVIKQRIRKMGGDLDRVCILNNTLVNGQKKQFDPAKDIGVLMQTIVKYAKDKSYAPSLLIIDPITSAITGDSHKLLK